MLIEITIENYRRSCQFGWGYTFTPTGEDAYSIETPAAPDYTGTLRQIQQTKNDDATWNNTSAFSNSAYFYKGHRITATWQFTIVDHDAYMANPMDENAYGWGWSHGWSGSNSKSVKIQIEVDESAPMGLMELARLTDIKRDTLQRAARAGRLETISRQPYLSTLAMTEKYKVRMVPKPRREQKNA